VWKDLTESVNSMAGNLTAQVATSRTYDRGCNGRPFAQDYGRVRGEILELKNTINTMVISSKRFAREVTRVAREVGTEGKARRPGGSERAWPGLEGSHRLVNSMPAT
jgi:hypothetical protein